MVVMLIHIWSTYLPRKDVNTHVLLCASYVYQVIRSFFSKVVRILRIFMAFRSIDVLAVVSLSLPPLSQRITVKIMTTTTRNKKGDGFCGKLSPHFPSYFCQLWLPPPRHFFPRQKWQRERVREREREKIRVTTRFFFLSRHTLR